MDILLRLKLPESAWDLLPLPSVDKNSSWITVSVPLPQLISDYLGYSTSTHEKDENISTQEILKQEISEQLLEDELPEDFEPELVTQARPSLQSGNFRLCHEGVGGTYFVNNNEGEIVAVFKPTDEEPGASNNPKEPLDNPLLPPGGGGLREIAAYLLDHGHFAGVPETFFLSGIQNPGFSTGDEKSGSLQRFISDAIESSEMGYSKYNITDIHRIGTLDIRLFNLDRNGENLLAKKDVETGEFRLYPIDHTYTLPPVTDLSKAYFEWQYWSQAKVPFSWETLDYINMINIENDAALLRSLGISEASVRTMEVSTMFLKEAANSGWTLFEIASVLCRGYPLSAPSQFEKLIDSCNCCPVTSSDFIQVYENVLKEFISSKTKERIGVDVKV